MQFKPILPKKDPFKGLTKKVQAAKVEMESFVTESIEFLKEYPPPWSGYRRTGKLGRGWKKRKWTVVNTTLYSPLVQGTSARRRKVFKEHGWRNVEDVRRQIWPKHRNKIALLLGTKTGFKLRVEE